MLTGLSIRDFVLIDALELAPEAGLTVLTGETGAGKSILLDALAAACGARSEAGLVRQGAEKASVTATFELHPAHLALARLKDNEITSEGEIILRRVLSIDGRSKAFINDAPVTIGLLRQVGNDLLEIHGQLETHGLLDAKTHATALDRFAGVETNNTTAAWQAWQQAQTELNEAKALLAHREAEEASLREAVKSLTELAPIAGEEEELLAARSLLQNKGKLAEAVALAESALTSDKGAENSLTTASRALAKVGNHPRLTAALAHIDTARDAAAEAARELEELQHSLEEGGRTLEQVEDRLYALRAAARRHGVTVGELPDLLHTLTTRLELLEGGEANLTRRENAVMLARSTYEVEARKLSVLRQRSARHLEKAITAELTPLKLGRAEFSIEINEGAWEQTGWDVVRFTASTNPGAPKGPLDKIASGGELARFMLALKVVLTSSGMASTLVFDEVDQGVGGAVATAVGERLAKLAKNIQVLVVTHSPQVAAKASQHWRVEKSVSGKSTRARVITLDNAARQEEVARMLAGEKVTEAARQAATELLT
jgi:DNA repair protein RecN (Recombination protein N)